MRAWSWEVIGPGGVVEFKPGIRPERINPGKPQQYNHERPHEALEMKTSEALRQPLSEYRKITGVLHGPDRFRRMSRATLSFSPNPVSVRSAWVHSGVCGRISETHSQTPGNNLIRRQRNQERADPDQHIILLFIRRNRLKQIPQPEQIRKSQKSVTRPRIRRIQYSADHRPLIVPQPYLRNQAPPADHRNAVDRLSVQHLETGVQRQRDLPMPCTKGVIFSVSPRSSNVKEGGGVKFWPCCPEGWAP